MSFNETTQRWPDLRLRSERAITSRRKETHKYDPSQIFLRVEWNLSRPTICLGNIGSWKGGSFPGTILHFYLTRLDSFTCCPRGVGTS